MKRLAILVAMVLFFGVSLVNSEQTEQVKTLLKQGLELYIQAHYLKALEFFEQAQALDPKNEIAQQYIESSRQRLSELEFQYDQTHQTQPSNSESK